MSSGVLLLAITAPARIRRAVGVVLLKGQLERGFYRLGGLERR